MSNNGTPIDDIWELKFRPTKLASVILPKVMSDYFAKHIGGVSIPHLLFTSKPGTGKTTIVNALCNELGWETLYLNGSNDTSIDLLREEGKIHTFAAYDSMNGLPKVIVFDEFQKVSQALQAGLKAFMEENAKTIRFFATSNDTSSIDDALLSRFQHFDFNFVDPVIREELIIATCKRCAAILTHVGCQFQPNVVEAIVRKYSPEIRSVLKILKRSMDMYGSINEQALSMNAYDMVLVDYILKGDYTSARNYMLSGKDYDGVWVYLFENLVTATKDIQGARVKLIPLLSEYMWRQSQGVISPDLNFCDALVKMMLICRV